MKKYLLQALLLLTSVAAFAQGEEEHSAEYNFGKKYAVEIIIGVIVIIVVIIWAIMRKKKNPPSPPPSPR